MLRGRCAQPVLRQSGHQGTREDVGRQHGEHDCLSQRHEQIARYARQQEHGHEHDADGESRDERRNRDLERALENGRLDLLALFQMPVDVLDGDGRVVDENADRERKTAERHEVDGLAERIEDDEGGDDGQRDGDGDDQGAAPAAQEQQHHEHGLISGRIDRGAGRQQLAHPGQA